MSVPKNPTVAFKSNITEVVRRLTAAFNNLSRVNKTYGIEPDEAFVFSKSSFDEFVCRVCEEHYGRIYSKRGIAKTFNQNVTGDFRIAVIVALRTKTSSERLALLVSKL
jgi:hypothetical protein